MEDGNDSEEFAIEIYPLRPLLKGFDEADRGLKTYRVAKYDPRYRDAKGFYTRDEWTSVSDVGKVYDGVEFTWDAYLQTEDRYVNVAQYVIGALNLSQVFLKEFELVADNYEPISQLECDPSTALCVLRNVLRENCWCKFDLDGQGYIHVGYEYYMYVGCVSRVELCAEFVKSHGLFLEEMRSPMGDD